MFSLQQKIINYKLLFKKYLEYGCVNKNHLNKLFTDIYIELKSRYRNTFLLLKSSLIFFLFLVPEDQLLLKTSNEIKQMFYLGNIVKNCKKEDSTNLDVNIVEYTDEVEFIEESINTYNFTRINTNVNLLEYHPLVLQYHEHKDKIIKSLINKLILAIKLDIFNSDKVIDYYSQIQMNINKPKIQVKSKEMKRKTTRGGIKKKIKLLKSTLNK